VAASNVVAKVVAAQFIGQAVYIILYFRTKILLSHSSYPMNWAAKNQTWLTIISQPNKFGGYNFH
jgi:hypothetical protein